MTECESIDRRAASTEVWGSRYSHADPTCAPFEPVRCHTFVTESTFGLPIFRWNDAAQTIAEIQQWWLANQQADRASILSMRASPAAPHCPGSTLQ